MINTARFSTSHLSVSVRCFSGFRKALTEEKIKRVTAMLQSDFNEAELKISRNPDHFYYDCFNEAGVSETNKGVLHRKSVKSKWIVMQLSSQRIIKD